MCCFCNYSAALSIFLGDATSPRRRIDVYRGPNNSGTASVGLLEEVPDLLHDAAEVLAAYQLR